jgi:hypothetical protein
MAFEVSQLEDLLRSAAQRQACLKPQGEARHQRILFLGNSYGLLSTACLETLVELGHDTIVGVYDPLSQGGWQLMQKRLKSRGLGVTLRKAAYLIRSKTRIALRGAGIPVSGFASVPELCRVRGLHVIRCANPNSPEFLHQVQLLGVDLIVVAGFSRILKRPLIDAPRLGCINVHLSLLPLYRGPEPTYWVLANFEQKTGVTIHYVDEGIDSGDIILQRELGIRPKEMLTTLTELSARMAAELLREAIPLLLAGQAPRIHQDHSIASYYSYPPRRTITERRERQLKKAAENS